MKHYYTVKQLAKLAGVSVRTLHVYDKMGLLKPFTRTNARYRLYGENEMLRLQQILFYKELDFQLKEIIPIIDDSAFDLVTALQEHRIALALRKELLDVLLSTIDNTITDLKNKTMDNFEKLYKGLSKEQALAIRKEAIENWGSATITKAENALLTMPAPDLELLKADQRDIAIQLKFKFLAGERPESFIVQNEIERHYHNIRGFWGVSHGVELSAKAYKGLAELYVTDERYVNSKGKPDPEFAKFMRQSMICFAESRLN